MAADKAQTVEQRIIALAEQFGRLVGTVEVKAEGWFEQKALNRQVEQIRDSATELLDHLGGAVKSGRAATRRPAAKPAATAAATKPAEKKSPAAKQPRAAKPAAGTPAATAAQRAASGRSGGTVDAPGKKHRKPVPSERGPRDSNQPIAKIKGAQTMRLGRRRG